MGPNFWTRLLRSRTNPALAPMSGAEPERALAGGLEGKEIQLKNNKLPLSARCIERFTIPRVKTHWPVIVLLATVENCFRFTGHPSRMLVGHFNHSTELNTLGDKADL